MGMQDVITLEKVLDYMDTGQPFNLVYVIADENRGTGGQIRTRDQWIKCNLDVLPEAILFRNKIFQKDRKAFKKKENKNRLIYNPATQDIRAVHIRLICQFNGKRVI